MTGALTPPVQSTEEAFAKLLGRQPSDKERERLYRTRDALGLRDNDALWLVVMALEHYDSLYGSYPALMARAATEAITQARGAFEAAAAAESVAVRRLLAEEVRRVAAKSGGELGGVVGVVGATMAAVVLFGAICVSAGVALGSGRGGWAVGKGGLAWRLVAGVLSIPAGWMTFALVVPGLVHVGRRGWRLARLGVDDDERVSGWGLVGVSALGVVACVVVLICVGVSR